MPAPFHRGFPVLGDLELTADGRDLVLVSGAEKVRQNITVRAQIFLGSWRYDRSRGVPYFQDILVAGPSVELVRRRFYELVAGTDGVVSVTRITVRFEGTTVYVDFQAVADTGEAVSGTLDFVAVG